MQRSMIIISTFAVTDYLSTVTERVCLYVPFSELKAPLIKIFPDYDVDLMRSKNDS